MNRWRKGIASWKCGDTLYQSIPFTWLLPDAEREARDHKGPVVAGGPAVQLCGAPWAETPDLMPFNALSFHNPCATFTTRGCPNSCSFCAVPKTEGDFVELLSWKPAPMVCDNNLFAATRRHFERVIDSLLPFPMVDFNQGLEARRLTGWHIDQIRRLQGVKIRFAFDHVNAEFTVRHAVEQCKANGLRDIGVYVLIGYKDTPDDAHYRLETVRSWGIYPNPMRYQPLDCLVKNSFVGDGWTEEELKRTMRYYSRLSQLNGIPYEEYTTRRYDKNQTAFEWGEIP